MKLQCLQKTQGSPRLIHSAFKQTYVPSYHRNALLHQWCYMMQSTLQATDRNNTVLSLYLVNTCSIYFRYSLIKQELRRNIFVSHQVHAQHYHSALFNFPFLCSIANTDSAQLNVIYNMQKYLCLDLEYMKGELLIMSVLSKSQLEYRINIIYIISWTSELWSWNLVC